MEGPTLDELPVLQAGQDVRAPQLVTINVAACSIGLCLTVLFLRWAQGRPKVARILETSASGYGLNKAKRMLDELARFEHQDPLS